MPRRAAKSETTSYVPYQELDPHEPVRRPSVFRRESFLIQFVKSEGPSQIALTLILIAIGVGCTIGVVPSVMSDRFARLNHGYSAGYCGNFRQGEKPEECLQGSSDAQNAAAVSSLVSNCLTFATSSFIGSLSDEYGRRGMFCFWHG